MVPLVSILAHTEFFGGGHRWSGLDPERLGAKTRYVGAGRFSGPLSSASTKAMPNTIAITSKVAEYGAEGPAACSGRAAFSSAAATATPNPAAICDNVENSVFASVMCAWATSANAMVL